MADLSVTRVITKLTFTVPEAADFTNQLAIVDEHKRGNEDALQYLTAFNLKLTEVSQSEPQTLVVHHG